MTFQKNLLTIPPFLSSNKEDEILCTQNFSVKLDPYYQKLPGILKVEFLNKQQDWNLLADNRELCDEFCQTLRLTELIIIKSFMKFDNQKQFRDNVYYCLINFNGEQIINSSEEKEIFVRQVPRYKNPYFLNINNKIPYLFEDKDFGKGFLFGNPLKYYQIDSFIHQKLLEILRKESEPLSFSAWFKDSIIPLLEKKFRRDDHFDAHKHPDKTGLCEVIMPSKNIYGFSLISTSQGQLYRTVLSIQNLRYPAIRFLPDLILNEFFILFKVWSEAIKEAVGKDFVYKIAILMNYAEHGKQQVHAHLIPSYKKENQEWERFAKEPYIHNVKGDYEYINANQMAISRKQTLEEFVKNFQKVLIKNLKIKDFQIKWP